MVDPVVDYAEDRKESRATPGLQGWGLGKLELMPCSVLWVQNYKKIVLLQEDEEL